MVVDVIGSGVLVVVGRGVVVDVVGAGVVVSAHTILEVEVQGVIATLPLPHAEQGTA